MIAKDQVPQHWAGKNVKIICPNRQLMMVLVLREFFRRGRQRTHGKEGGKKGRRGRSRANGSVPWFYLISRKKKKIEIEKFGNEGERLGEKKRNWENSRKNLIHKNTF